LSYRREGLAQWHMRNGSMRPLCRLCCAVSSAKTLFSAARCEQHRTHSDRSGNTSSGISLALASNPSENSGGPPVESGYPPRIKGQVDGELLMSPAEQKKRVAAPVAELLKPRGFRKSGLSFTAARDEATLIVALQASTGTTQAILRVTCNVAIQLHRFAAGLRPNVWDAQWHQRIGFFMPERCDHWWTCDSDEAAGRAGREIAALLEASALPEMERLAAPAALACLWRSGRSPGLTDGQRTEYLSALGG